MEQRALAQLLLVVETEQQELVQLQVTPVLLTQVAAVVVARL
jgi:hypothetical protein